MKIENGKIVSATARELWVKWISEDWDEVMPFPEYIKSMEKCGVTIKSPCEKCVFNHQFPEKNEPVYTDSEV